MLTPLIEPQTSCI